MESTVDLTRIDSFSLGIAQWCIHEMLPDEFKNRNVFFTEISISDISVSELKSEFYINECKVYKARKIKAYFTTLTEASKYKSILNKRPKIEGVILYRNIGNPGYYIWGLSAFKLKISDYPDIMNPSCVCLNVKIPFYNVLLNQKLFTLRFIDFFKNLFYCSLEDQKFKVVFKL